MRKKQAKIFYRTNWQIRVSPIRIIDSQGKQVGILTLSEARQLAGQKGLDLVEIAPRAQPPVVKLTDYAKFKYQEQKRRREEKRKQKGGQVKELRFSPFIGEADLKGRLERAKKFSQQGERLKVTIRFRGRQITKQSFGYELIEKISQNLVDYYQMEEKAKIIGKRLIAFFKPVNKNEKENKAEN